MKKDKILDIMVAQHALIETLFTAFKDEVREKSDVAKSFFSDLVQEVKKHFFIEEQAIFNLLPWKDLKIAEIVEKLKKEHSLMINMLEKASADLKANLLESESFSVLMKSHVATEEKELYPLLDEKLTDDEKMHIISRIEQLPFGPK